MPTDKTCSVPLAYRMSIRFNYIIFPLDLSRLIGALQGIGFTPLAPIPPIPASIFGRSLGSGLIAGNGNCLVDVNSDRQFIGVQDSDLDKTLERFNEMSSLLASPDLLGNHMKTWFIEFQARLQYWPKANGLGIFKQISSEIPLLEAWSHILPSPPALFHIRVNPIEQPIDSPDYYEIIFEPNLACPQECYEILIVFRNPDRTKVEGFARDIKKTSDKLASALEKYAPK